MFPMLSAYKLLHQPKTKKQNIQNKKQLLSPTLTRKQKQN